MTRTLTLFSALWGLLAVVFGSLYDHVWASYVSDASQIALRYHQTYSVVILVSVLFLMFDTIPEAQRKFLSYAALCFASGSLLFSSSLYGLSLSGIHEIAYITPIGGVLLMGGWACLFLMGIKFHKK